MQLTPHATRRIPHGASRLVQVMCAWSVKTRHAPSGHRRGARVNTHGHATATMHKYRVHPPPPNPPTTRHFPFRNPSVCYHVIVCTWFFTFYSGLAGPFSTTDCPVAPSPHLPQRRFPFGTPFICIHGIIYRTTGAPQNHWFGPAGDPRAAGIGTIEAIRMVWSCHRLVYVSIMCV